MSEKPVAIKFTHRATIGNATYNAGDIAAFAPHIAAKILKADRGTKHDLPPATPTPEKPKA